VASHGRAVLVTSSLTGTIDARVMVSGVIGTTEGIPLAGGAIAADHHVVPADATATTITARGAAPGLRGADGTPAPESTATFEVPAAGVPSLLAASLLDGGSQVRLLFSEALDPRVPAGKEAFRVTGPSPSAAALEIASATVDAPASGVPLSAPSSVTLTMASPITAGGTYTATALASPPVGEPVATPAPPGAQGRALAADSAAAFIVGLEGTGAFVARADSPQGIVVEMASPVSAGSATPAAFVLTGPLSSPQARAISGVTATGATTVAITPAASMQQGTYTIGTVSPAAGASVSLGLGALGGAGEGTLTAETLARVPGAELRLPAGTTVSSFGAGGEVIALEAVTLGADADPSTSSRDAYTAPSGGSAADTAAAAHLEALAAASMLLVGAVPFDVVAFEAGKGDTTVQFATPVSLRLAGTGGAAHVFWLSGTEVNAIEECADATTAATAPTLAGMDDDCHVTDGTDTVVWTRHLTVFGATREQALSFTATATSATATLVSFSVPVTGTTSVSEWMVSGAAATGIAAGESTAASQALSGAGSLTLVHADIGTAARTSVEYERGAGDSSPVLAAGELALAAPGATAQASALGDTARPTATAAFEGRDLVVTFSEAVTAPAGLTVVVATGSPAVQNELAATVSGTTLTVGGAGRVDGGHSVTVPATVADLAGNARAESAAILSAEYVPDVTAPLATALAITVHDGPAASTSAKAGASALLAGIGDTIRVSLTLNEAASGTPTITVPGEGRTPTATGMINTGGSDARTWHHDIAVTEATAETSGASAVPFTLSIVAHDAMPNLVTITLTEGYAPGATLPTAPSIDVTRPALAAAMPPIFEGTDLVITFTETISLPTSPLSVTVTLSDSTMQTVVATAAGSVLTVPFGSHAASAGTYSADVSLVEDAAGNAYGTAAADPEAIYQPPVSSVTIDSAETQSSTRTLVTLSSAVTGSTAADDWTLTLGSNNVEVLGVAAGDTASVAADTASNMRTAVSFGAATAGVTLLHEAISTAATPTVTYAHNSDERLATGETVLMSNSVGVPATDGAPPEPARMFMTAGTDIVRVFGPDSDRFARTGGFADHADRHSSVPVDATLPVAYAVHVIEEEDITNNPTLMFFPGTAGAPSLTPSGSKQYGTSHLNFTAYMIPSTVTGPFTFSVALGDTHGNTRTYTEADLTGHRVSRAAGGLQVVHAGFDGSGTIVVKFNMRLVTPIVGTNEIAEIGVQLNAAGDSPASVNAPVYVSELHVPVRPAASAAGTAYTVTLPELRGYDGSTLAAGTVTATYDTQAPTFTAAPNAAGTAITATFSENMRESSIEEPRQFTTLAPARAFTISGPDGAPASVLSAELSSTDATMVTLTPTPALTAAGTYTITADAAVRDANGVSAGSSATASFMFPPVPADTVPPTLVSVVLTDSETVVATFSEAIADPSGTTFELYRSLADTTPIATSEADPAPARSGASNSVLTFKLTSPVVETGTYYVDLDGVTDASAEANAYAATPRDSVVYTALFTSTTISATTIEVEFREGTTGDVAMAQFAVIDSDMAETARAVTAVTPATLGDSRTVTLTLGANLATTGSLPVVTYTVPASGGLAVSSTPLTPAGVWADVATDGAAPVFTARTASATELTIEFDEPVSGTTVATEWSVTGITDMLGDPVATTATPTAATVNGAESLTLTLSPALAYTDVRPSVGYTAPTGTGATPLADAAGNAATAGPVRSADGAPPVVDSATYTPGSRQISAMFSEYLAEATLTTSNIMVFGLDAAGARTQAPLALDAAHGTAGVGYMSGRPADELTPRMSQPIVTVRIDAAAGAYPAYKLAISASVTDDATPPNAYVPILDTTPDDATDDADITVTRPVPGIDSAETRSSTRTVVTLTDAVTGATAAADWALLTGTGQAATPYTVLGVAPGDVTAVTEDMAMDRDTAVPFSPAAAGVTLLHEPIPTDATPSVTHTHVSSSRLSADSVPLPPGSVTAADMAPPEMAARWDGATGPQATVIVTFSEDVSLASGKVLPVAGDWSVVASRTNTGDEVTVVASEVAYDLPAETVTLTLPSASRFDNFRGYNDIDAAMPATLTLDVDGTATVEGAEVSEASRLASIVDASAAANAVPDLAKAIVMDTVPPVIERAAIEEDGMVRVRLSENVFGTVRAADWSVEGAAQGTVMVGRTASSMGAAFELTMRSVFFISYAPLGDTGATPAITYTRPADSGLGAGQTLLRDAGGNAIGGLDAGGSVSLAALDGVAPEIFTAILSSENSMQGADTITIAFSEAISEPASASGIALHVSVPTGASTQAATGSATSLADGTVPGTSDVLASSVLEVTLSPNEEVVGANMELGEADYWLVITVSDTAASPNTYRTTSDPFRVAYDLTAPILATGADAPRFVGTDLVITFDEDVRVPAGLEVSVARPSPLAAVTVPAMHSGDTLTLELGDDVSAAGTYTATIPDTITNIAYTARAASAATASAMYAPAAPTIVSARTTSSTTTVITFSATLDAGSTDASDWALSTSSPARDIAVTSLRSGSHDEAAGSPSATLSLADSPSTMITLVHNGLPGTDATPAVTYEGTGMLAMGMSHPVAPVTGDDAVTASDGAPPEFTVGVGRFGFNLHFTEPVELASGKSPPIAGDWTVVYTVRGSDPATVQPTPRALANGAEELYLDAGVGSPLRNVIAATATLDAQDASRQNAIADSLGNAIRHPESGSLADRVAPRITSASLVSASAVSVQFNEDVIVTFAAGDWVIYDGDGRVCRRGHREGHV